MRLKMRERRAVIRSSGSSDSTEAISSSTSGFRVEIFGGALNRRAVPAADYVNETAMARRRRFLARRIQIRRRDPLFKVEVEHLENEEETENSHIDCTDKGFLFTFSKRLKGFFSKVNWDSDRRQID